MSKERPPMMEKTAFMSATISIIYDNKHDEELMQLCADFLDGLMDKGIEVDSIVTVTGMPKLTKALVA